MNKTAWNLPALGVILFSMCWFRLPGETIKQLEGIVKPETLHVSADKTYIIEREKIHIIATKTGNMLTSFGKKGEGPGEFKRLPHLKIYPDYLLVTSMGKMMFFSHDGTYLREQKHPFHHYGGALLAGENIVGKKIGIAGKNGLVGQTFGLYNQQLNLLRTLYHAPNPNMLQINDTGKTPYMMIKETIRCDTYKNLVFIADSRSGLFFKVFNSKGRWQYDINVPCEKIKIPPGYKEKTMEKLRLEPWWREMGDRMEPIFPEYFPQIRDFSINNNKLYIMTYIEKDGLSLLKTFDLNGKQLGKSWIPSAMNGSIPQYSICSDQYFYLLDNEENEIWELHKVPVTF